MVLVGLVAAGVSLTELEPGSSSEGDGGVAVEPLPRAAGRSPTAPVAAADGCVLSEAPTADCGPLLSVDELVPADVIVREDLVILRRGSELAAHRLPGLGVQWRTEPLRHGELRIREAEEGLLVSSPDALALVETATGEPRWVAGLSASGNPSRPAEAWVVDDAVMALTSEGTLHVRELSDGTARWHVDDAGRRPVATPDVLVVLGHDGIRAWAPDDPRPRWERTATNLDARRPVDDGPAPGPIPLMQNRGLLELATGDVLTREGLGPRRHLVLEEGTVEVRWPSGVTHAELAMLDPDGTERWTRSEQPLPCCVLTALRSAPGEVALQSTEGAPRIYDLDDGGDVEVPLRADAKLVATTAELAIWRRDAGLTADDRRSGREVFHAEAELWDVDPVQLGVEAGLMVVEAGDQTDPDDTHRYRGRRHSSAREPT
jgi:hypothetical protein